MSNGPDEVTKLQNAILDLNKKYNRAINEIVNLRQNNSTLIAKLIQFENSAKAAQRFDNKSQNETS